MEDKFLYKMWFIIIFLGMVIYQVFIKSHDFVWSDHIDFSNNRSEPRLISTAILVPDDLHPRYFRTGNICAFSLYKYPKKLADSPQEYLRGLKNGSSLKADQFVYIDKNGITAFFNLKDFNQYKYQLLDLVRSDPNAEYNFNPKKFKDYEGLEKCQTAYIDDNAWGVFRDSYETLVFREKYAVFSRFNGRDELKKMLLDPNTIVKVYLPVQENMHGAIDGNVTYFDTRNGLELIVGTNVSHRNAKLQSSQIPNYVFQKDHS